MEKMDGRSKDIVEDNIEKLKSLFPDIFSEDKIDFDRLRAVLGGYLEEDDGHYSFNWHDKQKAIRMAQTPTTATLRPAKEESVDWATTQNLFIEGDNLEALKLLQKSYHRKVKMIYIDPPYNKGKDFIYPDNHKDNLETYLAYTGQIDDNGYKFSPNSEANGRYHTNWLNMMYPRLKLARNLLRDDGIIFISIDEDELINLQKICVEIFGEENTLGNFPVVMNLKGNQDAYGFAETHEYIVVCLKSKNDCQLNRFPINDEDIMNNWLEDEYGLYTPADNLRATGVNAPRKKRPHLWYPIFLNEKTKKFYTTENNMPADKTDIEIFPINEEGEELSWYWQKNTFNNNKHNLILKHTSNGWQFYRKQRPKIGDLPTSKPKSFLYKPDYSTSTATIKLKKLMGAKVFDGPKPVPFIIDLITIGSNCEDVIMDFFSGSGTLAHAVMQLNAENKDSRKFICVQLPEPCDKESEAYKAGYATIAEISKERIRRAADKIRKQQGNSNLDLGFKVFKLDSSNFNRWDADFDTLEQDLMDAVNYIKQDRSKEDLLYEVLLKTGLELNLPIEAKKIADKTVYSVGSGALIACFDKDISVNVAHGIIQLKKTLQPEIMRVIFKDDGFKDDEAKANTLLTLKQSGIEDVKSI